MREEEKKGGMVTFSSLISHQVVDPLDGGSGDPIPSVMGRFPLRWCSMNKFALLVPC